MQNENRDRQGQEVTDMHDRRIELPGGADADKEELYRALSRSAEQLSDLKAERDELLKCNAQLVAQLEDLKLELSRYQKENEQLRDACKFNPAEFISLSDAKTRLEEENIRLQNILSTTPRIPRASQLFDRTELWSNQRVAVLVDVQNMYYSAKKIYNSKISFQKLLPALLSNRRLVRAIAYTVEKEGADQEKFYEMLKHTGFEVKRRDLIVRNDGSRKGDWDMGIAIDAISLIDKVDVMVLVTGDGDFAALVTMLKSRGVRVEVASFMESTAESLINAANDHFVINHDMLV